MQTTCKNFIIKRIGGSIYEKKISSIRKCITHTQKKKNREYTQANISQVSLKKRVQSYPVTSIPTQPSDAKVKFEKGTKLKKY